MDMWTFSLLLEDIAPEMEVIEGRIFLDRQRVGREGLMTEISTHADLSAAQSWINMLPIDDLLKGVADDWSINNPAIERIKDIYARSWLAIAKSIGADVRLLSVSILRDADSGDVVLRLDQAEPS